MKRKYHRAICYKSILVFAVILACIFSTLPQTVQAAEGTETVEPTDETTDSSGEAAESSDETTDLSGEAADSSGEAADPSGETTEPSKEDGTSFFFQWEQELTDEQKENSETNYLYRMSSAYGTKEEKTGIIHLSLTGTLASVMQQATVVENEKNITITIPQAEYLLEKKEFHDWKEYLSTMTITAREDGSLLIVLATSEVLEYTYTVNENTLELQLFYPIPETPPKDLEKYALNILKPEGFTISSVTNEDLYESSKFKIILEGDHVSFFKGHPVVINSKAVKKVTVTGDGENTVITVTTASLQGYKIYEKGNYFVVKIADPRKIYSSILVLDAGHGGKDNGAKAHGMKEKNLNYKIIYTLMKDYFSGNAPEIKVYWTRKTDTFITLASRAAFAKKVGADAFISLHMNSASRRTANGTEVYYSTSNNKTKFDGITSKKMAELFKNRLVGDLNTHDRGVKSAGFYVIKHNTVPAILIELGFLTGSTDYKKLKKGSFQKKAAKSIYTGIRQMFSSYETGRA